MTSLPELRSGVRGRAKGSDCAEDNVAEFVVLSPLTLSNSSPSAPVAFFRRLTMRCFRLRPFGLLPLDPSPSPEAVEPAREVLEREEKGGRSTTSEKL